MHEIDRIPRARLDSGALLVSLEDNLGQPREFVIFSRDPQRPAVPDVDLSTAILNNLQGSREAFGDISRASGDNKLSIEDRQIWSGGEGRMQTHLRTLSESVFAE